MHTLTRQQTAGPTSGFTLKFKHLYYKAKIEQESHMFNTEYSFSMAEHVQGQQNLGQDSVGCVESVMCHAYPVETVSLNLKKLIEVTKQCKGCLLLTE